MKNNEWDNIPSKYRDYNTYKKKSTEKDTLHIITLIENIISKNIELYTLEEIEQMTENDINEKIYPRNKFKGLNSNKIFKEIYNSYDMKMDILRYLKSKQKLEELQNDSNTENEVDDIRKNHRICATEYINYVTLENDIKKYKEDTTIEKKEKLILYFKNRSHIDAIKFNFIRTPEKEITSKELELLKIRFHKLVDNIDNMEEFYYAKDMEDILYKLLSWIKTDILEDQVLEKQKPLLNNILYSIYSTVINDDDSTKKYSNIFLVNYIILMIQKIELCINDLSLEKMIGDSDFMKKNQDIFLFINNFIKHVESKTK